MNEHGISTNWETSPHVFSLQNNQIHLWRCLISQCWPKIEAATLSDAELAKLSEIKNDLVRLQYATTRWMIRQVLSKYLLIAPDRLLFKKSVSGKPEIDAEGTHLQFNLSHSGDWSILAVAIGAEVGVDIEKINVRRQKDGIIERWFDPREIEVHKNLPEEDKLTFFHQQWTEKESVLKAWGVGLVQLTDYSAYANKSWKSHFSIDSGYSGCVARTSLNPQDLSFFNFNPSKPSEP